MEPFKLRYQKLVEIVETLQTNWSNYQLQNSEFMNISCPVVLCEHTLVESMDDMKCFYKSVLDSGGEGIMLNDPDAMYEGKRSNGLLKYKPSFDMEAKIIGYKDGTGKYKGKLGALVCQPLKNCDTYHIVDEDEAHEFSTSGMDDSVRESYLTTHPIGTIITIQCSGFTNSGKPRFARYLRIRDDIVVKENIQKKMEGDNTAKLCVHIFERMAIYEKSNDSPFKEKHTIQQVKH